MAEVLLRALEPEDYQKQAAGIVREKQARSTVIYVTTNRPYAYLKESMRRENVDTDGVFFIDCVTKRTKASQVQEPDNGVFVAGPQNLTDLSLVVNQCLRTIQGKKTLIFDSLGTLARYHDDSTLKLFFNVLIDRVRAAGVDGHILILESEKDESFAKTVRLLVEEVHRHGD